MNDYAHIPEETLALYALQALDPAESAAVRTHVTGCAECRAELARAEGDLALVAMSVEQHPLPEGARARFLQRMEAAPPAAGLSIAYQRPRKHTQAWAWGGWLAAAALLLLSIGLGIRARSLRWRLNETSLQLAEETVESRQAHLVLDLLTAPMAQHVLLTAGKTPPAPSARAVYLASRGALVMEASNLKPLPANKTYELWVIPSNGTAPVPAGLFQPDANGSASVVMPLIPRGVKAKAFGVTEEKEGGSSTPTAPILLAGAAPAVGE